MANVYRAQNEPGIYFFSWNERYFYVWLENGFCA
jgi:hypothetical protein